MAQCGDSARSRRDRLLAPMPAGLPVKNAWRYFALFVTVIAGLITEPIPPAIIGMGGVIVAAMLGLVRETPAQSAQWALSGFGNATVWLIFAGYMFTLGYTQTGLGKRIALHLVRLLGHRTLGLGYAVTLADLALAPFTASATARSAGTVFPDRSADPRALCSRVLTMGPRDGWARTVLVHGARGQHDHEQHVRDGAGAEHAGRQCDASDRRRNRLLARLVHRLRASWRHAARAHAVAALQDLSAGDSQRSRGAALGGEAARAMGAMSRKEFTLLVLVCVALALWIVATAYVDPAVSAMLVVLLMVISGVVSWNDVIGHSQAWNILIWFATLVTLAGGLAETKFLDWLVQSFAPTLRNFSIGAGRCVSSWACISSSTTSSPASLRMRRACCPSSSASRS